MVQLDDKSDINLQPVSLAQSNSKSILDNTELIQNLGKSGLTDDQIAYLKDMTNSNAAPDTELLNQLNAIAQEQNV
jgi:hypothetical protein